MFKKMKYPEFTVVVTLTAPPPRTTQRKSWTPVLTKPFRESVGVGPLLVRGGPGSVTTTVNAKMTQLPELM